MKILYFTRDFGAENIEFARKNGLTMRNAAAQETGANVEPCDYVYGDDIPENYRAAYPLYTLPESGMELAALQAENEQLQAKYEQQNQVIAQYENETNALKSALDEAQAKIAELEAKLSEPPVDKQPEGKSEQKKGKGE